MPQVSNRHIRLLKPYLIGKPRANGEWDMYCPLHGDERRSASLNRITGTWYCFAGCGGGGVLDLIKAQSRWVEPGAAKMNGHSRPDSTPDERVNEGMIKGWASALLSNEYALDYLVTERGIHTKTLMDFDIGWDAARDVYTIPVRGEDGAIWNVRRYTPNPKGDTKIWSVKGMRVTELYPVKILDDAERVIICEGEWDTLLTIQMGFPAVTRTSGAGTWYHRWNEAFKDKLVYICQDRDVEGVSGSRKIARALSRIGIDVRIAELPYSVIPKHGKDLSDFWMEHDRADFESLLADALSWRRQEKELREPEIITVLETFDSRKVAEPVKVQVTIKGRKEPGYILPKKAHLECTRDAGPTKCPYCPLFTADGEADVEISPSSPVVLQMIDAPKEKLFDILRAEYGAVKCSKLEIETREHQSVEVLIARPSVDHADGTQTSEYKNLKITSVGRHDTANNSTIVATGALYPNPRSQHNEFLAWDIVRQETSVDHFDVTPEAVKLMSRFSPRRGQRPLRKLGEINRQLAEHVTHIIGRPEMHAMMDLTFHSVLSFKFDGKLEHRGWLETLIAGDTRTGKSEAAERLVRHFGAGEIVGGEGATIAGLVGGLQQVGGKEWVITWGVIPINDKRIVVIDELSGLQPEDISKMSDIRASGVAKLTKIEQDMTHARTRLLWMGNPRDGGMNQYTYGIDCLKPLIGNPEDIARFDLAMIVTMTDVSKEIINRPLQARGSLRFTSEACHTLLMWAWTRQPDQIVWARGAEDAVFRSALDMGSRYIEDPPLVQGANIRIKIARVACALAARTFSTDASCEKVVVTKAHVEDAVTFMNMIYEMPAIGYEEHSRERLHEIETAEEHKDEIRRFLIEHRGLAKLMRSNGSFRRQDVEEVLGVERGQANAIINKLWNARMISKEGADSMVQPTLHQLLREVSW
jgi:5S rRNA maturation endonuclease (ribonuclease M5)